ncbi:MAG: SAM-dependent methyltransferase [Alphaproteobacteria bacterium]|nr:SAM-dependent methyltransferase [Alphaproteobacteria bacterium]
MNTLGHRIAELIGAEGPLSVAQFMSLCLYDPEGGAYAAGEPIGQHFITAPEISQAYGELAGLWVAQTWLDQGRPDRPRLMELGPGRGTLMADALRALKVVMPDFLDGAEIVLIESSPGLQRRQETALAGHDRVRWHKHFGDVPADRPLFLIANEFFDCLPVRQFVKTEKGWCERMVIVREGKLAFAVAPAAIDPSLLPPDRVEAPEGGFYEVSPASLALAAEIAATIAACGGGGLIIDYGYDGPGYGETLQAVAGHAYADVLVDPGKVDVSAHVDFVALTRAVRAGGAAAHGPVPQGRFLQALGMAARAERLIAANPGQADAIAAAIDRLVNPDKMGSLFRALGVAPKNAPPLPGF